MKNIIMYREGEQSWILWIKKRIKNNLNFLAIAEGPTGIGKSWAMISVAYDIDNSFETRQVAFSLKDVMEILESDWFNKKKWKIIVFDEAQCDISNRKWQSRINRLMNYLLSTFRHRNIILLFTSPYMDFLDSQTLKLLHCKFEIRGHNRKTKQTQIRPKLLQYNSKMKKFYEHSLFVIKNRKYHKQVNWIINKPPQHLIDPYEKDKVEFTTELNKKIMRDLNDDKNKPRGILDTGTAKQRERKRIFIECGGNTKKTAKKIGVSVTTIENSLGGRDGMEDLRANIPNLLRELGVQR